MKQLEKECCQNSLSLALLCMQKALLLSTSDAGSELPKNCVEVSSLGLLLLNFLVNFVCVNLVNFVIQIL